MYGIDAIEDSVAFPRSKPVEALASMLCDRVRRWR